MDALECKRLLSPGMGYQHCLRWLSVSIFRICVTINQGEEGCPIKANTVWEGQDQSFTGASQRTIG